MFKVVPRDRHKKNVVISDVRLGLVSGFNDELYDIHNSDLAVEQENEMNVYNLNEPQDDDNFVCYMYNNLGVGGKRGKYYHYGNKKTMDKQGRPFKYGDIIDVKLNSSTKTLSFLVNGKSTGISFRNLPCVRYKLFFSLYEPDDIVVFLGFNQYENTKQSDINSPFPTILLHSNDQNHDSHHFDLFAMTLYSVKSDIEKQNAWIIDINDWNKLNATYLYQLATIQNIPWRQWNAWCRYQILMYLKSRFRYKNNNNHIQEDEDEKHLEQEQEQKQKQKELQDQKDEEMMENYHQEQINYHIQNIQNINQVQQQFPLQDLRRLSPPKKRMSLQKSDSATEDSPAAVVADDDSDYSFNSPRQYTNNNRDLQLQRIMSREKKEKEVACLLGLLELKPFDFI